MPYRQIHLDFHTPPQVTVGDRFDEAEFFATLEAAHVNSLAAFAKCHHGLSYFDTKVGARHPGLAFDLFGRIAAGARRRGVELLAYFSLNVDEAFADLHPEHVAQFKGGAPVDTQILQDGSELYWRWLCPNRGDWLRSFFFPHVEECLRAYPTDGVFIDMAGYLPGSCHCPDCLRLMRAQGLDPDDEVAHNRFNSATHDAFARELRRRMDAIRPGLRLEIGCYCSFGDALHAKGVASEFYAETLPFQTGWFSLPALGRYYRNSGLPLVGVTGRFLKNWGDFGTVASPRQLKYQLASQLLIGADSCVGDHMRCDGRLEGAVYDIIGEAFRFIEPRQAHCVGLRLAREAAILVPGGVDSGAHNACKQSGPTLFDSLYGAAKLFMETHRQWTVVDPAMDWGGVELLAVLAAPATAAELARLAAFVASGGHLLLDPAALRVAPELRAAWFALAGIAEARESEFPGSFYVVDDPALTAGVPAMAHYVHAAGLELVPAPGAASLARQRVSHFPRGRDHFYGHFHGPDVADAGPAILVNGNVATLAQPLFAAYLLTGYWAHRQLLDGLVRRALPRPLVSTDAPGLLELVLGEKDGRLVLQALPFVADRRHRYSFESVNEAVPIGPTRLDVRVPRPCRRVWDPVSGAELPSSCHDGVVSFTLPAVSEHTLVALDCGNQP